MDYIYTKHALDMLNERRIPKEWADRTITDSDVVTEGGDGNMHYYKTIDEHGGRMLHVVINTLVSPKKVVTVFFDRKAGRTK